MLVDPDTLHYAEPNTYRWSRANFEEAMPGVLTPLSWSFWGPCSEQSSRRIFTKRFGVFGPDELTDDLGDTTTCLFWGRAAANVDLMRRVVARIPGADPDAFELQIFGSVSEHAPKAGSGGRVPIVVLRTFESFLRAPRRVRHLRRTTHRWWSQVTARSPATVLEAATLLEEARSRFTEVMTEHGFAGMIGQVLYEQLAALCREAGLEGWERVLSTKGSGVEETVMIEDLRSVADGRLSLSEFVGRHGYHGPDEGEISSISWREDPEPVRLLVERCASGDPSLESATAPAREAARLQLLQRLGWRDRSRARLVLALAQSFVPLREVGKAAFLQCIDAGRHAAHRAAELLAREHRLEDPADVAFLTLEDIAIQRVERERIARRRERRQELMALEVPISWVGVPEAQPRATQVLPAEHVRGIPASGGRHVGFARLVQSPVDFSRLEPGDVLVCRLTDPSWTALFSIVGAVVVDVGGTLSHAAIVAREVGIPCVIGTKDGTRRLAEGALVEVDGDAGLVRLVDGGST